MTFSLSKIGVTNLAAFDASQVFGKTLGAALIAVPHAREVVADAARVEVERKLAAQMACARASGGLRALHRGHLVREDFGHRLTSDGSIESPTFWRPRTAPADGMRCSDDDGDSEFEVLLAQKILASIGEKLSWLSRAYVWRADNLSSAGFVEVTVGTTKTKCSSGKWVGHYRYASSALLLAQESFERGEQQDAWFYTLIANEHLRFAHVYPPDFYPWTTSTQNLLPQLYPGMTDENWQIQLTLGRRLLIEKLRVSKSIAKPLSEESTLPASTCPTLDQDVTKPKHLDLSDAERNFVNSYLNLLRRDNPETRRVAALNLQKVLLENPLDRLWIYGLFFQPLLCPYYPRDQIR